MNITTNLPISRIAICSPKTIYYSSLGFIPKLDRTFHYIYNLFSPKPRQGLSVNAAILKVYSTLAYSTVDDILALILFTKKDAVNFERDLKDAF